MKKYRQVLFLLTVFICFSAFIISCTKINEPTTLGSNLIPGVDNIHTFETYLDITSNNTTYPDTTKVLYHDQVAFGNLNDPEFGQTTANVYFNLSGTSYSTYPFIVNHSYANNPDSLKIDSVVLSLAYTGSYGDTNAQQTIHVFQIANNHSFLDTTVYPYNYGDFATTGPELATATFVPSALKDTQTLVIKAGDTIRVGNVLRIRLTNNALIQQFLTYDTVTTSPLGGFANDSIFRSLFRGFALKADNPSGNGNLTYFNLTDQTNSKLTVYFRATVNGKVDTATANFVHAVNGQANIISRINGGNYATYLANGPSPDDRIYLQSQPGSFANLKIQALDTFSNKVIHRAEIIATPLPSTLNNIFSAPPRLMVDRINFTGDTTFFLQNDLVPSLTGSVNFEPFGGTLGGDNTYRINITRHVQAIITKHEPNDTLRLYAPYRTILWASNLFQRFALAVLPKPALGRIVLAGGSYADQTKKLRLRIIYSKL